MSGIIGHMMYGILGAKAALARKLPILPINSLETLQAWRRRLAGARENSSFTAQARRLCHQEFLQS